MMANIGNILHSVLDVAQKVAPLLGPGGAAGVAAAQALSQLIDHAKAAAGPEHAATVAQLEQLQTQVNAHADSVIGRLRGPHGGGTTADD
jgi:hypothetical protein